jgi:hypothetical protein
MVIWPGVAVFLFTGYLAMARSFAYLGVAPLFIGEIVLGAFLLLKPRVVLGTWVTALLRPSPLNGFALVLLLFLAYGIWQVARGVLGGSDLVYTLKFFIFNYYALYMFLGMWVGLRSPDCLRKAIRVLGWVNGVYGIAFLLALRHVEAVVPGSDMALFSPPTGQVVVIVGLLTFERDLRSVWFILVINIVVTLAWQVRSEWLGLVFGILTWGLLTRQLGRVVAVGIAGLMVLGAIEFAGIKLPGRTGDSVSLSDNVARIIAPIDLDLAKQLSPRAVYHADTAEWRELWWKQIWISAHSTPMLEAFGHGYGFDLFSLAPWQMREYETMEIRTPHSVFYYALGYTGWAGVLLFAALQLAILRLLWQSYRLGGQPAGVVFWMMGMAMASFQGGFETPYFAIPFYLMVGMGAAPGLRVLPLRARSCAPMPMRRAAGAASMAETRSSS